MKSKTFQDTDSPYQSNLLREFADIVSVLNKF